MFGCAAIVRQLRLWLIVWPRVAIMPAVEVSVDCAIVILEDGFAVVTIQSAVQTPLFLPATMKRACFEAVYGGQIEAACGLNLFDLVVARAPRRRALHRAPGHFLPDSSML